jgi:deazaflavin-dependent oxidoreductase (nitroreductase family)
MSAASIEKQTQNSLAGLFLKTGNPLVSALLRSPLHSLLATKFMLVSVTGRKTGRTYTTPVNYVRQGDTLTVISRRGRTWWRNLSEPAPVLVRLGGKRRCGMGQVLPLADAERTRAVKAFYAAMGLHPDVKKMESTAKDAVIVRIELEGGR